MSIQAGDTIELENQSDGTWEGPYQVLDIGTRNDFLAGGLVDVLYLRPEPTDPDPAVLDRPARNAWKSKATRSDGAVATTYPMVWCRKVGA